MRLIDADKAYKVLTDYYHQRTEIQHKALKEAIERVPTVDPVKHGHWIKTDYEGTYECSVCGEMWTLNDGTPEENNMNYCTRCGAKMDEVEAK